MSTHGNQPLNEKTGSEEALLPEEEQLYREFEVYLNAISQEVGLPLIRQIEGATRNLQHVLTPLQNVPKEMQSRLDGTLQQMAQMSHESAVQMQQKLDSSLQQMAQMSHESAARMQQKLDSSLQQMAQMSYRTTPLLLRNLLIGVVVLTFISVLLQMLILLRMWR